VGTAKIATVVLVTASRTGKVPRKADVVVVHKIIMTVRAGTKVWAAVLVVPWKLWSTGVQVVAQAGWRVPENRDTKAIAANVLVLGASEVLGDVRVILVAGTGSTGNPTHTIHTLFPNTLRSTHILKVYEAREVLRPRQSRLFLNDTSRVWAQVRCRQVQPHQWLRHLVLTSPSVSISSIKFPPTHLTGSRRGMTIRSPLEGAVKAT